MLDIAITGGTALVGAECQPVRADVGIADGRVVSIGAHVGAARVSLDAEGVLVVPGFVDIHTHCDHTCPRARQAESKLLPGRHDRRDRELRVLAVPAARDRRGARLRAVLRAGPRRALGQRR